LILTKNHSFRPGIPDFIMAEREGFEPSVPLLTAHTISSRAPSASSDISPIPLRNTPFCPISVSGSNFNPQNTLCIPAVKILAFLELEQK
jgi:hypothetical protein